MPGSTSQRSARAERVSRSIPGGEIPAQSGLSKRSAGVEREDTRVGQRQAAQTQGNAAHVQDKTAQT